MALYLGLVGWAVFWHLSKQRSILDLLAISLDWLFSSSNRSKSRSNNRSRSDRSKRRRKSNRRKWCHS